MSRARAFLLSCLLAACGSALAQTGQGAAEKSGGPPNFFEVQQYDQPFAGWFEATLFDTYVPSSAQREQHFGMDLPRKAFWAHSLELAYGVTDRLTLGAYADVTDPGGANARYAQTRLLARYRFSERQELFFNPALYVEYYLPRGGYGDRELETRLILDKDLNDFRVVLNPTLSVTTSGDKAWGAPSIGLSGGVYYRRGATFQPGIEYVADYGAWNRHENTKQYVLPTVDIALTRNLTWHIGAGFGLTSGSDHVVIESQLRFEGDLLRPSHLFGKPAP